MARKKTKAKTKAKAGISPLYFEIIGLILIGFAIIIFFEYGFVGRMVQSISMFFFGNLYFAVPTFLFLFAILLMIKREKIPFTDRVLLGAMMMIFSLSIFSHSVLFDELYKRDALESQSVLKETWRIMISDEGIQNRSNALGGGMIGAFLFSMFHILFGATGAKVVAILLFFIGIVLVTGKAFVPMIAEKIPNFKLKLPKKKKRKRRSLNKDENKRKREKSEEQTALKEMAATSEESVPLLLVEDDEDDEPIISDFTQNIQKEQKLAQEVQEDDIQDTIEDTIQQSVENNVENQDYRLPPMTLLNVPPEHDQSGEYSIIQANAKKLEQTLLSFGVKAKVVQVHLGPAVTKYEVMPDVGVKVSRIVNLQDDLALALAAKDIRMEAPIPGKSAIGIEVPNSEVAVVTLREVLESKENNKPDAKLLIGFGRDIAGQAILAELNKMPHLLVAGSTGSGKSVCINGIIISILMRAKPHEVKMMLIDPKMVELNVYNGIPHLLAPVVTNPKKASQALQKVVSEMERRYDLFSHTGTRNIKGYNSYVERYNKEHEEQLSKLPYIVVIIDELADLMMVASHDVEDAITRLAQMARAAGIHLIIATQRPSVDVITGVIKANIPSRIAFAVSSTVDSRTILDTGGAERLLGRGDMLFMPAGTSKPIRVQGAFVSDEEVQAVVDYVIAQQKAQYDETMIPTDEPDDQSFEEETDELYDEAVKLVVEMQSASISMLQRRFRIGYSRAARIVDQMEARGVVGPPDGSRPRQVLISSIQE
ncbi:FtsK/SpoIIIE family DNA translocase [Ureibacillus thermosphaericus]|uniref:S-DNA-T family DNA segregation ATPase FtsK/SpoIIIE n=1 Tax=Ureibacillus thermosphaericus TaxID=51173 RepID=A0A840PY90_URETH|nr:DNA translocase FtsK [Ureibacillus thermosphaericus]MBB5147816.1 S-DNA-T family DNA segregation ATPase FtsK/SpoIIIE [Ureibacillus thermosphaericus]NKZ30382.1 DNA translocase FtsK [Ureibacillus thermosphaericus]